MKLTKLVEAIERYGDARADAAKSGAYGPEEAEATIREERLAGAAINRLLKRLEAGEAVLP